MVVEELPSTEDSTFAGERWLLAAGALVLFFMAFGSPVGHERSDARFSLLVSQAILEKGTIRLDAYAERSPLEGAYQIIQREGHDYYYFPLGTSIVAIPFVLAANLAGLDMTVEKEDALLQNLLSSFSVVAVFLVGHRIVSLFLEPLPAMLATLTVVAGSSLLSTMATALWNIDVAVLFICFSLWLLLRAEMGEGGKAHPILLGSCLFLAFLSRPTTAIFVAVILGYLLLNERRLFLRTTFVAAGLFLLHLLFNEAIYGQLLSPYAVPSRLSLVGAAFINAFGGLLFSPSRGFLVYHPHFTLVLAGTLLFLWRDRRRRLQLALLFWLVLTVALIATFEHWWGGWSYGPRLLTELIPAFFVLMPLVWRQAKTLQISIRGRFALALYLFAALMAVFIHAFQGLYNESTSEWNGPMAPDIDQHPEYIFDWEYPQFMASNRALCARNMEHLTALFTQRSTGLTPYHPGERITYTTGPDGALFVGWSPQEADFRWSACPVVHLLFRSEGIDPGGEYKLKLAAGSLGGQHVTVLLNGELLGEMTFPPQVVPPVERQLGVTGRHLNEAAANEMILLIPGAQSYGSCCGRRLGLAFNSLEIAPAQ